MLVLCNATIKREGNGKSMDLSSTVAGARARPEERTVTSLSSASPRSPLEVLDEVPVAAGQGANSWALYKNGLAFSPER